MNIRTNLIGLEIGQFYETMILEHVLMDSVLKCTLRALFSMHEIRPTNSIPIVQFRPESNFAVFLWVLN